MNQSVTKKSANTEKTYHVNSSDLPVSCPSRDMSTWDSHPKIYMEMSESGEAVCQYCGAQYILDDK